MSLTKNFFNRFSEEDKALQKALKNILGYKPGYLPYYVSAITHRSQSDLVATNNERLEYLGDAFIGSIVGEYLFKKYPTRDEGYLTEMRSKIVSRQSLNEIALRMGMQKIVRFNKNDKMLRRSHIFGNALEALVGAVYLDVGFEKTRKFILKRILATYIDMEELETTEYNFKNKLYTWAQRKGKHIEFITVSEKIEAGRKIFTVGIEADGQTIMTASGYTKKEAGQLAAQRALEKLEADHQDED
ncbi:ribonuclease III [Taibaiella chishuiensis]|uniref:Ribonuclease 3 n=1 Tax=Taibaiella chishuiensis TaxID=1434707 RepID=A0A2P8DA84_9BACT|nr:ribonuclease III [Taibaiella chishuiensis]PSK94129.1 ribonuclease-3 [Taibaiella chishuiensis]